MLETIGDIGGVLVGFLLTIAVLSFVIKDNPAYRVAVHILIGVSAGYAVVVVIRDVFSPLFDTLFGEPTVGNLFWILPLILALILLTKAFPRTAWIGNISMAAIIGIGTAVALVGAISGSLIPQINVRYEKPIIGLLVAILTILTLAYFFFAAQFNDEGEVVLPRWYPFVANAGRVVITIALAGVFAGILSTSLVLVSQRVGFFIAEFGRVAGLILP